MNCSGYNSQIIFWTHHSVCFSWSSLPIGKNSTCKNKTYPQRLKINTQFVKLSIFVKQTPKTERLLEWIQTIVALYGRIYDWYCYFFIHIFSSFITMKDTIWKKQNTHTEVKPNKSTVFSFLISSCPKKNYQDMVW